MPTTPTLAFRYPDGTVLPDVPLALQNLATDVENALVSKPRCKISQSAIQTFSVSGTTYDMDFASSVVNYDTDTMADVANDRILIKTAGWYIFSAFVGFAANGTGARDVFIDVAGVHKLQWFGAAAPTGVTAIHVSTEPILCAVNDAVKATITQTSTASLNSTNPNGIYPYLTAHWYSKA